MMHPPGRAMAGLRPTGIRRWAIWSIPAPARAFLIGVEMLAAALTIGLIATERLATPEVVRFGVLLLLTIGYAELSNRSERMRRYLGAGRPTPRPNPLSVWSFAALLVLPIGWAAAFIAVQYAHTLIQRRREQTSKPYRQVFVAAAAMLAQLTAAAVILDGAPGDALHGGLLANLSVLLAAAVFTVVDLGVMLTGMWLTARPASVRAMLPDCDALGYELVSLASGVATADLLLHTPWLVPIMLAPVAYLHRSSMMKMLREAARTDSKTGLLNTIAWTEHARLALSRCDRSGRSAAVLIIDVDHFKAINDLRGHLVGDQVLTEVANVLRRELRGHDGIGRFGGDEFVVVLEELDPADTVVVARRLQTALAAIRVGDLAPGMSMGMAHTEDHSANLERLLAAADDALYAAKTGGRGRLCVAPSTAN
jgi:diguanylate cyclase